MTPLAQLQQRVAAAIVGCAADSLADLIAATPAKAAARTSVYINNHHIGLREAVATVYPVVRRLLGADCFELLAREHVARYPKQSGNLLDYGGHLADLIEATAALAGLPYLADVARLEWLRHEVFHAADSDPDRMPSLAGFAALDEATLSRLRLRWVPATRLYQSRFPILRIWDSNQQTQPTPVSLDEGGVKCLLLRAGLKLTWLPLSNGEFVFCEALTEHTVCAAAELALGADPHFNLALTLARCHSWLQHDEPRSTP